jgi:hypothetical protein
VIKVRAFDVVDDVATPRYTSFDGSKKRLVGLFVSEAMIRLLLTNRTIRSEQWEALLVELEEERLKAFARRMGWIISRALRDPGPRAPDKERPFAGVEQDLKEGLINTVLVGDFEQVPRQDLFRLWELTEAHAGALVAVAPHAFDENLQHDNIDYDSVPLEYADNPALADRLGEEQVDAAIDKAISRFGWLWTYYVADLLAAQMGAETVRTWREQDPTCRERHWKEVLTYFAIARARKTGRAYSIPLPKLLTCASCRRRFLDAAIPLHLAELSRYEAVYCRSCLAQAFFYDDKLYPNYVGPPPMDTRRDFEDGVARVQDMARDRFGSLVKRVNEIVKTHEEKGTSESPSVIWLESMAAEGELDTHGAVERSDSFFKAADGHLLGTYGLAVIDNYLTSHAIPHRLDVKYPRNIQLNPANTLRSDLLVRGIHVEFLGMRGHDEFHKQVELRLELARRNRLQIIGIYAEDLVSSNVLERKCEPLLTAEPEPQEEAP